MELTEGASAAMQTYVRAKHENSSPRHVHSAQGFGLDSAAIHERFADYCDRFDLLS
jgi:hypothetical protein